MKRRWKCEKLTTIYTDDDRKQKYFDKKSSRKPSAQVSKKKNSIRVSVNGMS